MDHLSPLLPPRPETLLRVLDEHYHGRYTRCELLHAGFNDTFLIEGDDCKHVLRV